MSSKTSLNLTIKDIANLSGFSKSTVSRVINHDPNVKLSTREKILSMIEKHHFIPSKSAQVMRGFSNKVIGIVVSRLDSTSENLVLQSMLPYFYQSGYDVIIMESQFSNDHIKTHLSFFENRRVDGIVLFAFTQLDIELLRHWQTRAIIMTHPYPDFASICYDDSGAVQQLLLHFYNQGHKSIAYIGVELDDHTTGFLRHEAYCSFCVEYGLEIHSYLGKLNYHTGYQYAEKIVASEATVIVCATDSIAIGVNKYLLEHHIDSILVASIGSSPLIRFLFPNTISAELGFPEAGTMAAKELLGILQKKRAPLPHLIPSNLIG